MVPSTSPGQTRRGFLGHLTGAGALLATAGCSEQAIPEKDSGRRPVVMGPAETLMRDHGLMSRLLLLYEDSVRRLNSGLDFKPQVVVGTAEIIHTLIESFHQRLEEVYLFPRFVKSGTMIDLIEVLKSQHVAGRRLTKDILDVDQVRMLDSDERRKGLAHVMAQYIRMVRPHEAREDSALLPLLRNIVSAHEFEALREEFDREEREHFGPEGSDRFVGDAANLEKTVGLYDLASFTPR